MLKINDQALLMKSVSSFNIENAAFAEILYSHYSSIMSLRKKEGNIIPWDEFEFSLFKLMVLVFPEKNNNLNLTCCFYLSNVENNMGELVSEYINTKDCPVDGAVEILKSLFDILFLDVEDFDSLYLSLENCKKEKLENTINLTKSWMQQ